MALKGVVDTLDSVPEPLREHYTARDDGKFVLAADDLVPKGRLDEFRENNRALHSQITELRTKFDGIDPEVARELLASKQRQKEGQLLSAGKVDELVTERTGAMKTDFDRQLQALTGERDKMKGQLEGLLVDTAIRDAATKAGVRNTAIDDVLLRGRQVFRLHDGKAAAFQGDQPIYGKDSEPMQIGEWVSGLTEKAPHLFESSNGGGARAGSGTGRQPNTISRDDDKGILANLEKISKGEIQVV